MDDAEALDWNHKTVDLRDKRRFDRQADDAESERVSELLGNEAQCRALTASYTIVPHAPDRYRVFGEVQARIVQICGVTLDPIEQAIDEQSEVTDEIEERTDELEERTEVLEDRIAELEEVLEHLQQRLETDGDDEDDDNEE